MVKLDLLENIGLNLDALTTDENQLVKIEKLLKAEKQFNENISTDDIESLLQFLKSDWKNFKALLQNPNIQSVLFNKGNYVTKKHSLEINHKAAIVFLEANFYENISKKLLELTRNNDWDILKDIQEQYPYVFGGAMQEIVYSKLKSNVDVILSLVKQKVAPSNYEKHFSLQEGFYSFLGKFDPVIFEPIEDEMFEILSAPIEGHGEDFYNYFNELKKRLTKGSSEAEPSEGCSERTWTYTGYVCTLVILILLYRLLVWNNGLFWLQLVGMFLMTRFSTYKDHMAEEKQKSENAGEIILNEKYWKQRKVMFYFFLTFVMGFFISLPVYGYYLLSNKFYFLKPIGVIFVLFMAWGFYANAKDEKKKKANEVRRHEPDKDE